MRAAAPTCRIGMKKCRVEREPSVSWLPYLTSFPVAWATFTFAQSASISSATMSGMPVRMPCPISERWQTMVTVPSGAIDTKACGLLTVPCGMPSAPHLGASAARAERAGNMLTASPRPGAESRPFRTPRRLTFSIAEDATSRMCFVMSRSRSLLDGGADALIGATSTDVAVHDAIYIGIRGMRRLFQERRGLHDLAGLTITALWHVQRAPSLLERVIACRVEPLDRGDCLAVDVADRRNAGSYGFAVDVDGAGAARGHPAAKFRSREPEDVSEIPEHRHRRVAVECLRLAIDMQSEHASSLSKATGFPVPSYPAIRAHNALCETGIANLEGNCQGRKRGIKSDEAEGSKVARARSKAPGAPSSALLLHTGLTRAS